MLSLCQSPLHNLKSTRSKEGHSAQSSVIAHKCTMTPGSCPYQTSLDATLYVESVRVSAGPVQSVNETLPKFEYLRGNVCAVQKEIQIPTGTSQPTVDHKNHRNLHVCSAFNQTHLNFNIIRLHMNDSICVVITLAKTRNFACSLQSNFKSVYLKALSLYQLQNSVCG